MLISSSEIQLFLTCPAAYWYYQKYVGLKMERIFGFGLTLHRIIEKYYELIPNNLTPSECWMYISRSVREACSNQDYHIVMEKYKYQLKNFESFEIQRLSWSPNPKPLFVEQWFEKEPFKGIIDAMVQKGDEKIVLDWKSGFGGKELSDYYKIQGYIYRYLTNCDRVIFVFLSNGKLLEMTEENFNDAKLIVESVINQIKQGVCHKNRGEHCRDCRYQIRCKYDDLGLQIEEEL